MKISSSIGVTGGQQTTMAATFAEVVASLGYEYTWAWDMATVTAGDGHTEPGGYDTITNQYAGTHGTGLRVAAAISTSSSGFFKWSDANLDNTTHSAGTGGIPDDAIPTSGETSHPGQYLSWVVTIDKFDITSPTTIYASSTWELGNDVSGRIINLPYFRAAGFGSYSPEYVDGVATGAGWGVQSDWTALVGKISTITYDISPSFYTVPSDDDPRYIWLAPLYHPSNGGTATVDYDITYHGAILSATPPNITSLPVHTSSPSIT